MAFFDFLKRPKVDAKAGGIIKAVGLDAWYSSLTENQKYKFRTYNGRGQELIEGEVYTSQTGKHLLWTTALNANHMRDFTFGVWLALEGMKAEGSMSDQHFLYNALIEAYDRMSQPESMAKYCWEEIRAFKEIRPALEKDFRGEIPPSIPCRDKLIDWVASKENNAEELERLFSELVENGLLTQEDADAELDDLKSESMREQAEGLLRADDFERAKILFDTLIAKDVSEAADIYKSIGNHFLKAENLPEALSFFQKALQADPLIAGVKAKLQKIAKALSVEVKEESSEAIAALHRKSRSASEWWEKRDVADECVKFGEYELAEKMFQEALSMRLQSGSPADSIYSHMAKMHERQKGYAEAMFYYLLSIRESNKHGDNDPPKFVSQAIERCLKKAKESKMTSSDLCRLALACQHPDEIRDVCTHLFHNAPHKTNAELKKAP